MDCTDIHDFDSSTYCFALDIYKNQFSEIWHHEIINIIKELRVAVSTDTKDLIESKINAFSQNAPAA
jgi:ribonucleotide reductase beta subunit family protein with ferritin-like domain